MAKYVEKSKGYVIIKPIVIHDIDHSFVKVIAIHCTQDEYIGWINAKRTMHEYLIPVFYLADYLTKKGVTELPNFMGDSKIKHEIEANIYIAGAGEGYENFLLIKRVKAILLDNELSYEEFIDAYAAYLKAL